MNKKIVNQMHLKDGRVMVTVRELKFDTIRQEEYWVTRVVKMCKDQKQADYLANKFAQ